MTRSLPNLTNPLGLALALTFCSLLGPFDAHAQNTASPFNGGGNSGFNTLGSGGLGIGTPEFTRSLVSLSDQVTVEPDGSLTAPEEKLEEVEEAIRTIVTQPDGRILEPVVEFSPVAPEAQMASLTIAQGLLPASNNPELLAQTTNLANQLVASGVEPPKANQLVSLLVSLSKQPNLNQLSAAINLFNQVIREASPEVLNSLRNNPAFVAISTTLRSARMALGT